jgi:hypothetical protein
MISVSKKNERSGKIIKQKEQKKVPHEEAPSLKK